MQTPVYFMKLMIAADFFLLPRLVDICQIVLKHFINVRTVIPILTLAKIHNAEFLERFCIFFLAFKDKIVRNSNEY